MPVLWDSYLAFIPALLKNRFRDIFARHYTSRKDKLIILLSINPSKLDSLSSHGN